MALILAGLRVIDAASYVAGPAASTVMADFGADVIKIEPPEGDSYRRLAARHRTDYNWQLTSRGKRALALDLKQAEGQAVMHNLVKQADVLVVNFNAGQLAEYQLQYELLRQLNPRLIFAQITGYGSRGPDRNKRAFDLAAWWARTASRRSTPPFTRSALSDTARFDCSDRRRLGSPPSAAAGSLA